MPIQLRETLICEPHSALSPTDSRIFPRPRPACFDTRRSCASPAERSSLYCGHFHQCIGVAAASPTRSSDWAKLQRKLRHNGRRVSTVDTCISLFVGSNVENPTYRGRAHSPPHGVYELRTLLKVRSCAPGKDEQMLILSHSGGADVADEAIDVVTQGFRQPGEALGRNEHLAGG